MRKVNLVARKNKKNGLLFPIVLIFGLLGMGTLFIIFTPGIFGTLSSSSEVSKYQGNSAAGDSTATASTGLDSLVSAVYSVPARFGLVLLVLVGAVVAIIVVYKMNLPKTRKA